MGLISIITERRFYRNKYVISQLFQFLWTLGFFLQKQYIHFKSTKYPYLPHFPSSQLYLTQNVFLNTCMQPETSLNKKKNTVTQRENETFILKEAEVFLMV